MHFEKERREAGIRCMGQRGSNGVCIGASLISPILASSGSFGRTRTLQLLMKEQLGNTRCCGLGHYVDLE